MHNGVLNILGWNKRIKLKPERSQNCKDEFGLILTCEEQVYDQIVKEVNSREQESVHVINVNIQGNYEEAILQAFLICDLCQHIQLTEDMDNQIQKLL